ncbi:MAG: hypothetical protein HY689_09700 [Chloroflexi bacterium]|nr:hypothetical protein [Chloroflexota bacterium]
MQLWKPKFLASTLFLVFTAVLVLLLLATLVPEGSRPADLFSLQRGNAVLTPPASHLQVSLRLPAGPSYQGMVVIVMGEARAEREVCGRPAKIHPATVFDVEGPPTETELAVASDAPLQVAPGMRFVIEEVEHCPADPQYVNVSLRPLAAQEHLSSP